MKTLFRAFALTILFTSFTYAAPGGVISGTVKSPDGATFKGAFVRAQNTKTKITVNVLSDRNGAYRIQNLDAGEYQVTAAAVGFKSDPRTNVKVDAEQSVSLDFALQKGTVRWADLSIHEGQALLPEGAGTSSEGRTAADNATVRSVFVIGPDKKVKAMLTYPMSTGRNFDEVLRLLDSCQLTAKHSVATPVNWRNGQDVIIPPAVSDEAAKAKYPNGWKTVKPYLRVIAQPQG
jgi:hypothetical protein